MNFSSAPVMNMPVTPPNGAAAPQPGPPVSVSPSRREVRRADPSLSFQVTASERMAFFDVIVTTDPALFDPAMAHARTPKNFRSSRQDFEGKPIEIETGFYMLPRAFIRDTISQQPRPTRLHYIAVAYAEPTATDGVYSLPPEHFAQAPYVLLAADLSAASLSHVLGMAVSRIGTVNGAGRVMAVSQTAAVGSLPRMIGGLPVSGAAPHRPQRPLADVMPVARRNGAAPLAPDAQIPHQPLNGQSPVTRKSAMQGASGTPPPNAGPDMPPPPAATPTNRSSGFVDDDFVFGQGGVPISQAAPFRDYDASGSPATAAPVPYDDGLGPMMTDAPETPVTAPQAPAPIPPLDSLPPPTASQTQPQAGSTPTPAPAATPAPATETQSAKDALVQAVLAEGVAGRYEALNLDGAFRGRMGPDHPYHQRAHDGLSFGPHQASQDSGELGELLDLMRATDPATFAATFGPQADALVTATTVAGPMSGEAPDGRGARLQPVEGADLWQEPWISRFRAAAAHPPFQAAMRAQIIARRLDPMQPVATGLGLEGLRGRAMLLSLAIHLGVAGATTAARAAVNPFDTPAKLSAVLTALDHSDLQGFQSAHGLTPSATADDATHFALLSALRALGPDAPVPVPDAETIMDRMVTAVGPGVAGDALLKLRVSGQFRSGDGAAPVAGQPHV